MKIYALIFILAILLWSIALYAVFTDVTEEATGFSPTAMPGNNSVGWVDINSDGLIDIWAGPYHFFLNNGDNTFTQRSTDDFTSLVNYSGHHRGSFADADNDGDIDFVLASHLHTTATYDAYCFYFENLGAPDYQFSGEIIYTYPLNVKGGQPVFVDADGDGDAEIYLAMFGNWPPTYAIGLDKYFDQDESGNWQDVTAQFIPQLTDLSFRRPSRGANCCDYDNDFDMDIFLPVYGISYSEYWYNMLWQNDGSGNFVDYADPAGVQIEPHGRYGIGLASGACFGDYNNDGWFDLITANIHGWAALYDNNRDGTFSNTTENSGLFTSGPEKQWHNATWMEWDNDGDEDLILSQWYGNEGYTGYLFQNLTTDQQVSFEIVSAEMGLNEDTVLKDLGGTAAGDYDQDGDLDLLLYSHSAGYIGIYLYRNDLSEIEDDYHWLTIKPVGNGSSVNTTAIGSQVRVFYTDGTASAVKQIETASSDETCHQQIAHFGLREHDTIQQIMIRWLDGTREYWQFEDIGQEVDQELILEYGSGSPNSSFFYVDALFTGEPEGTLEAPFITISEAIAAAESGDLIRIEPGFYFENLDFAGKELKLHAPGSRGSTILFPNVGTPAVNITDCPGVCELSGLTIMSGQADNGAGVYCENSTLNLEHMEFISNSVTNTGGAVFATESSINISSSRFQWNIAQNGGSAIYLDGTDCNLINSLFSGNIAENITIENTTLNMHFCTLADNSSGAAACLQETNGIINIDSSILWNQSDLEIAQGSVANITNSCLRGGWTGNIAENPKFVNTSEDDYHLTPFSPCLGSGNANLPPEEDLDGNPRPNPEDSNPDIGCFEHERFEPAMSRLYVAQDGSDITGNGTENNPWATVQYALDQTIGTDSVLVLPGIYTENIVMPALPVTLGSLFMVNGDMDMIEQTILDGDNSGTVITIDNGQNDDTRISGFTITQGTATNGGGIRVQGASPTLEHLIIHDCQADVNGGGIYLANTNSRIDRLLLHHNNADNFGGAIVFMNSSSILTNCTIADNCASSGGGVAAANFAGALVNTIISDNQPDAINLLVGDIPVYYSNITDGWEGDGNIDADPLFVNPDSGDYSLHESSPCIDAGIAYLENEDQVFIDLAEWQYAGNAPDMGSWEYGLLAGDDEYSIPETHKLWQNRPNPFNPVTTIDFQLAEPAHITLKIYNIRGQLLSTLIDEKRDKGQYSIIWDASDTYGHTLSSGVYFYSLQTEKGVTYTRRMLLLK